MVCFIYPLLILLLHFLFFLKSLKINATKEFKFFFFFFFFFCVGVFSQLSFSLGNGRRSFQARCSSTVSGHHMHLSVCASCWHVFVCVCVFNLLRPQTLTFFFWLRPLFHSISSFSVNCSLPRECYGFLRLCSLFVNWARGRRKKKMFRAHKMSMHSQRHIQGFPAYPSAPCTIQPVHSTECCPFQSPWE
jgi:hypothetical protein